MFFYILGYVLRYAGGASSTHLLQVLHILGGEHRDVHVHPGQVAVLAGAQALAVQAPALELQVSTWA